MAHMAHELVHKYDIQVDEARRGSLKVPPGQASTMV